MAALATIATIRARMPFTELLRSKLMLLLLEKPHKAVNSLRNVGSHISEAKANAIANEFGIYEQKGALSRLETFIE